MLKPFKLTISLLLLFFYAFCLSLNLVKALIPVSVVNGIVLLFVLVLLLVKFRRGLTVRINSLVGVSLLNIILICVHYVYSLLFKGVDLVAATVFTTQFSLFWVLMLTLHLLLEDKHLTHAQLIRILRKLFALSMVVIVFSFLERMIPISWLSSILDRIYVSKGVVDQGTYLGLPLSYFATETGEFVRRSGSLFFEPVTFGLFIGIVMVSYSESKPLLTRKDNLGPYHFRWLIVMTAAILSFVKSAYLLLLPIMIRRLTGLLLIILMLVLPVTLLVLAALEFIQLHSLLVHAQGLYFGIVNSFENPLAGHGVGTSGFAAYNILSEKDKLYDFFDPLNVLNNGNESLIGVIAYQYGIVYLVIYIISLVITGMFLQKRLNYGLSLILVYVFVSMLTESVLSIIFQITLSLHLALLYSAMRDRKNSSQVRT